MIIGFTGTRNGMTEAQFTVVSQLLKPATEAHLGDCRGADAEAYWLAAEYGAKLVGHPPLRGGLRAWLRYDEEREAKHYLERNRDIVDECELLIGAPAGPPGGSTSGTWYTIRYAHLKKPGHVVMPDGELRTFGAGGARRGG